MRRVLAALILIVSLAFGSIAVSAETTGDKVNLDTSAIKLGILQVSYTSDVEKKSKFRVEKDGHMYTYNINNDGIEERFPLQLGDGSYKVSVLQNTNENRYKIVYSESIAVDLDNENAVYLGSVQNINWNESTMAAKKAKELVKGLKNDKDKINAIYNYLISNVKYDFDKLKTLTSDYNPDVDTVLYSGKGICYDYSSTFASMLRSIGIPAKLVKGYTPNTEGYHAWNEVYNRSTGKWITIDTTYDSQMKAAKARYNMEKSISLYSKVNEY